MKIEAELKYALEDDGEVSVIILGIIMMLQWCASNLALEPWVRYKIYIIGIKQGSILAMTQASHTMCGFCTCGACTCSKQHQCFTEMHYMGARDEKIALQLVPMVTTSFSVLS